MSHIFISYAKKDTRPLAEALYAVLMQIPGVTAWMDRVLEPDQSWASQIMDQIDACDYFIVLLSPDVNRPVTATQRRSFVLNEIDYVQQLEQHKPLLPVMAIKTRMPVQIAGIQYIDATAAPTDPTLIVERVRAKFGLSLSIGPSAVQPAEARVLTWAEKDHAKGYAELAWGKLKRSDFAGALADCDVSLRLYPDSVFALGCRGRAKLGLGDFSGAIIDFDNALKLDPNRPWIQQDRQQAAEKLSAARDNS